VTRAAQLPDDDPAHVQALHEPRARRGLLQDRDALAIRQGMLGDVELRQHGRELMLDRIVMMADDPHEDDGCHVQHR
jgi:hypothetical protein